MEYAMRALFAASFPVTLPAVLPGGLLPAAPYSAVQAARTAIGGQGTGLFVKPGDALLCRIAISRSQTSLGTDIRTRGSGEPSGGLSVTPGGLTGPLTDLYRVRTIEQTGTHLRQTPHHGRRRTDDAMRLADFKASLMENAPPAALGRPLQALWHEAKGDWDRAHELAQAEGGETGAWVHAYLHRVEGDAANAAYWYRRAGKPVATGALREEWERIVAALLPNDAG